MVIHYNGICFCALYIFLIGSSFSKRRNVRNEKLLSQKEINYIHKTKKMRFGLNRHGHVMHINNPCNVYVQFNV